MNIPENELNEEFNRSANGPGGQRVNKTATMVRLRWDYTASNVLTEEQKLSVRSRVNPMYLVGDEIVVSEQGERSLFLNRENAREKLTEIIRNAIRRPKVRHATKPTRASRERRLKNKSMRGKLKAERSTHWE